VEDWFCIGHSHVVALAGAAALEGAAFESVNLWNAVNPFFYENGAVHVLPEFAERVARRKRVLSVIGFSPHAILGNVEHPRPFDVVLPAEPDLPVDEACDILPAEALRIKLAEIARPFIEELRALRAVIARPFFQFEPPPPVGDDAWSMQRFPTDIFPGEAHKIGSRWLRYKIWRMYCDLIREACVPLEITYLPSPKAALDADGFLSVKYAFDHTHGNGDYGALVLEALRQAT
jgi:hypothetical protein